jgi:hypothetical protein
VVFPEPEGPISARKLPLLDGEIQVHQDGDDEFVAPIFLIDGLQDDRRQLGHRTITSLGRPSGATRLD